MKLIPDQAHGSLPQAAEGFSAAEDALRSFLESAKDLSSAELKVDLARDTVLEAANVLTGAEKSLADGSSAIYSLASDLKDTARELKNNAIALRELDPAAVSRELASVQSRLDTLIASSDTAAQRLKLAIGLAGSAAVLSLIAVILVVLK